MNELLENIFFDKLNLSLIFISLSLLYFYSRIVRARKDKIDSFSFYLADRNLNIGSFISVLLSTSYAFANGIWYSFFLGLFVGMQALVLSVAWVASFILISFFFKYVQPQLSNFTIHGIVKSYIGENGMRVLVIATVIGFTANLGWELAFSGKLLQSIFNIDLEVSKEIVLIIVLSVIPASYCFLAGFKGNSLSDNPQNILTIIATLILFFGAKKYAGSLGGDHTTIGLLVESFDISNFDYTPFGGVLGFLTLFFVSLVWQFVDMSSWQSIAASQQDENKTKWGLRIASVVILIFPGFFSVGAGAFLHNFVSNNDVNQLMILSMDISPFLFALAFTGFIAAILSTVDGFLIATAQTVSWDLFKKSDDQVSIRVGRYVLFIQSILGALVVLLLINYLGQERVGLIVPIIYSVQIILLGPVIFAIYKEYKKSKMGLEDSEINTKKYAGSVLSIIFILALLLPFIFTFNDMSVLAAVSPFIFAVLSFSILILPYDK